MSSNLTPCTPKLPSAPNGTLQQEFQTTGAATQDSEAGFARPVIIPSFVASLLLLAGMASATTNLLRDFGFAASRANGDLNAGAAEPRSPLPESGDLATFRT